MRIHKKKQFQISQLNPKSTFAELNFPAREQIFVEETWGRSSGTFESGWAHMKCMNSFIFTFNSNATWLVFTAFMSLRKNVRAQRSFLFLTVVFFQYLPTFSLRNEFRQTWNWNFRWVQLGFLNLFFHFKMEPRAKELSHWCFFKVPGFQANSLVLNNDNLKPERQS